MGRVLTQVILQLQAEGVGVSMGVYTFSIIPEIAGDQVQLLPGFPLFCTWGCEQFGHQFWPCEKRRTCIKTESIKADFSHFASIPASLFEHHNIMTCSGQVYGSGKTGDPGTYDSGFWHNEQCLKCKE
jgi:hypothetical protein